MAVSRVKTDFPYFYERTLVSLGIYRVMYIDIFLPEHLSKTGWNLLVSRIWPAAWRLCTPSLTTPLRLQGGAKIRACPGLQSIRLRPHGHTVTCFPSSTHEGSQFAEAELLDWPGGIIESLLPVSQRGTHAPQWGGGQDL